MRTRVTRLLCALGLPLLLLGCGGSGGGGLPIGNATGGPVPTIDLAVFGTSFGTPAIHIYRDVLHLPATGATPDIRIVPAPADAKFIAFTGTHLFVAQEVALPAHDRFQIFTPADLAAPNPTPSATVAIPPPVGVTQQTLRGFEVHDGDIYTLGIYSDGNFPVTLTSETHVYRDAGGLANFASPSARIVHGQITTSAILAAVDSVAVDDDVLIATSFGVAYVTLSPTTLTGSGVSDRTLDQALDLGLTQNSHVTISQGEAYFHGFSEVQAFDNAVGLVGGQAPRFVLGGASSVFTGPEAVLRLGNRLFTRGLIQQSPTSVVGFDIGGAVTNGTPPDVTPGPVTPEDVRLTGVADTLVTGSNDLGLVRVYPNASLLVDGAEPTVFLWDPEIMSVDQVRAVAP